MTSRSGSAATPRTPWPAWSSVARQGPEPELVFALAELSWVEGRRLDRRRKAAALDHYLDTVAYAFDYLFDPDLAAGRHPSDPRFRLACDLYNAGLDRLIRAAQANGRIQPGDTIRLKINGGEQTLHIDLKSTWRPEDVHQLLLASDYEVAGLDSTHPAVRPGRPPDRGPQHRRRRARAARSGSIPARWPSP